MNEIWKDIEGYEGFYQVSNMGRVRSLKYNQEKILNGYKDSKGYLIVRLLKNKKSKDYKIHRLVATCFLSNNFNRTEIDHINCNRSDNRVENLKWVNHKENCNNPITKQNYSKCRIGDLSPLAKPIIQFNKNGEFIKKWNCIRDVERLLNFSNKNISSCCTGKRKTAYGYIWRYHYKSLWLKKHIPLINQKKVG